MAGSDSSGSYAEQNVQTAVGAAMIALSIFFVALRFYVRLRFNKAPLSWDDWLALTALVATVTAGLLVLMDPDYEYTPANILHLKLVYISSIFYFSIVCPAKLSILFLYRRVFSVSQSFNIQVLLLMAVVALFYVATTLASIFSCWPLKYGWINTLNETPYCFNYNYFWLATGLIEAVLDICLIALPVGMVSRLQMSAKKRMGITGVFLLGAFGICTGVVKAYEGYVPGSRSVNSNATVVWSSVHGGMGIICACLPVCWPLILKMANMRVLSRFRTSKLKNGSGSRSGSSGSGSSPHRWWHNYKPTNAGSWASSSATIGLSQLSRDERGNHKRAATYGASEWRRASDTEVPILAASTRHLPGVATADDGHELEDPALYTPQAGLWSDAGAMRPMEKAVHVIKRCEYPI